MSLKEVLVDIIIPLVAGFIGGSFGSIMVVNNRFKIIGSMSKDKRSVNNKNATYKNVGEVYNGDRCR